MTQTHKKTLVKGKMKIEVTQDYLKKVNELKDLPWKETDTPEGLYSYVKALMMKLAEGKVAGWRYNGLITGVNTLIRISSTAPNQVKELEAKLTTLAEEAQHVGWIRKLAGSSSASVS